MNTRERHEDTVQMAERYSQGESLDSIAASFGLARSTVGWRLKRHGVELRKSGRPRKSELKCDD